jgi:elongation factor G
MPSYKTEDIRNIALVGHAASGKTTLADTMLYVTGATNRKGSVDDKSSFMDFEEEEKERGYSVDSALAHVQYKGKVINIIDTPGAPDFTGTAIASLVAVETAVCVISAFEGIGVNTRRMMQYAADYGVGRAIAITHIDSDNTEIEALLATLKEMYGTAVVPINLPAGGGKNIVDCLRNDSGEADFEDVGSVHSRLIDAVVETDEQLMEQYLEAGEISMDLLLPAVPKAIAAGKLIPVMFTATRTEVGVREMLDVVAEFMPSPVAGLHRKLVKDEGEEQIQPDVAGPFLAQVFKVWIEPKSNIKYSFFRVHSGSAAAEVPAQVDDERKGQRLGHILKFQGSDHDDIDLAMAGDLVAVAKLDLHLGQILHTGTPGKIALPKFPSPMNSVAVEPRARGDEVKINEVLGKLADMDPCFRTTREQQTGETIISGMGDLHLRVMLSRMARFSRVEVNTKPPKIPYRETITVKADGHYRHKKQTGGAGQFGEVFLTVEPIARGSDPPMEWDWAIYGGTIPGQFEPAVHKGADDLLRQGVIAGYPLQDLKVIITDGKHHPVDSKEVAFRIAGKLALRDAVTKAKPVILEPIVKLEVTCPIDKVGDITGDLASRRGRPQGQETLPGNMSLIQATVPLSEISDYSGRLSSLTGGRGSYVIEFSHYEQVPPLIQQALMDKYKPKEEE